MVCFSLLSIENYLYVAPIDHQISSKKEKFFYRASMGDGLGGRLWGKWEEGGEVHLWLVCKMN